MTPVEFRRHLHRHPELSFRETESARFIAEALREAALNVIQFVCQTDAMIACVLIIK